MSANPKHLAAPGAGMDEGLLEAVAQTGTPPKWFRREIGRGLQKLLILNLDFAPARLKPVTQAVGREWIELIWHSRSDWEQGPDEPRLRDAFYRLCIGRTRWPAPRNFMDTLDRRRGKEPHFKMERLPNGSEVARRVKHDPELTRPKQDYPPGFSKLAAMQVRAYLDGHCDEPFPALRHTGDPEADIQRQVAEFSELKRRNQLLAGLGREALTLEDLRAESDEGRDER